MDWYDLCDRESYTIFRYGTEDKHEFGVAFIVDQKIKCNILDIKPINERICIIRKNTKFFILFIINVHAEIKDISLRFGLIQ